MCVRLIYSCLSHGPLSHVSVPPIFVFCFTFIAMCFSPCLCCVSVPCLAFHHLPLPVVFSVMSRVPRGGPGAEPRLPRMDRPGADSCHNFQPHFWRSVKPQPASAGLSRPHHAAIGHVHTCQPRAIPPCTDPCCRNSRYLPSSAEHQLLFKCRSPRGAMAATRALIGAWPSRY